jgi:hypothetical protein
VISSPKQFQLIRTTGLLYEKNIAAWAGLFQLLSAAERATVFGVPKKDNVFNTAATCYM